MFTSACPFQITDADKINIVKDGTYRKLIIKDCQEEDSGRYKCEADGRKTEAVLNVEGNVTIIIQVSHKNFVGGKPR